MDCNWCGWFSHNPALKPNAPELADLCKKYDISPDNTHYCPAAGKWVGESADMVYTVVKLYSWNYVVHNDGNSWKPKGEDIFLEYKAAVSVMPSNPHDMIFPKDCNYHSVAKEAERASRPDDATDAASRFAPFTIWGRSRLMQFADSGRTTSCWMWRSLRWPHMWTC